MVNFGMRAGIPAAAIAALASCATTALAADMDAMVTKAPPVVSAAAAGPSSCTTLYGFFLTDCQLIWYGVGSTHG